jgi:hypothetical protein
MLAAVFHRHKDDHQDAHHEAEHWEKVTGNVVEMRLLPSQYPPHPKVFVVQLHPEGRDPFQAEVPYNPTNWDGYYADLFLPPAGAVTGFVVGTGSGEVRFDMSDKRNSMAAHLAGADTLMDKLLAGQPADPGEAVTGPPWVVPATCPNCDAPVDQATASMDPDPKCGYCHQPLPVQPRARF